jgi:Fibronectin type III domain
MYLLMLLLLISCQSQPAILPPTPPNLFQAEVISSQIVKLYWTGLPNVDGYRLERRSGDEDFTVVELPKDNVTTFEESGLQPVTTYTYRLRAMRGKVLSEGKELDVTTFAFDNPTTFEAKVTSFDTVDLSWSVIPNATYRLERAQGSIFEPLVNLSNETTSFSDSGLETATTYRYRLTAVSDLGTSSGIETEVTTSDFVYNLSYAEATTNSSTSISLIWIPGSDAIGYLIERRTSNSDFTEVKTLGARASSYTDTGLQPDTLYTYRIRTITSWGRSTGLEVTRRTFDARNWSQLAKVDVPSATNLWGAAQAEDGSHVVLYAQDTTKFSISRVSAAGIIGPLEELPTTSVEAIAMNSAGDLTLAWRSGYAIAIKRYRSVTGWGDTELVPSPRPYPPSYPRLVLDESGKALLVWKGGEQLLSATASKEGSWSEPVVIDDQAANIGIYSVQLASDPSGAVLMLYAYSAGGKGEVLRSSRYANDTWSPPVTLTATLDGHNFVYRVSDDGTALAIWADSDLMTATFDPVNGWEQPQVLADLYAPELALASDGEGNYLATWSNGSGQPLYAAVYRLGQWGAKTIIDDNAGDVAGITFNRQGQAVVFADDQYQRDGCSGSGLFTKRYSLETGWGPWVIIDKKNCYSISSFQTWLDGNGNTLALFGQYVGTGPYPATWFTGLKP